MPGDVHAQWAEADLRRFLGSRTAENKYLECKAFIHYDPELEGLCQDLKVTNLYKLPFHSEKPINSFLAYRVIESIVAFANAEGGLLLLGVAETLRNKDIPGTGSIPIVSSTSAGGGLHFEITGIEADGVGFVNGCIDEDQYKRQLQDILFPKDKEKRSYLKKEVIALKGCDRQIRQKSFTAEFKASYRTNLIQDLKLIPCHASDGRILTVAALIVLPSPEVIVVTEIHENKYSVVKIPLRQAFNNNGDFSGPKALSYLQDRLLRESTQPMPELLTLQQTVSEVKTLLLDQAALRSRSLRSPAEFVPEHLREALEDFIPPARDGVDLGSLIRQAIADGHNVFIHGESGMGKSLLMARTFLDCDVEAPCCYYAIDRTQGRDYYAADAVLVGLRRQVLEQMGLSSVESSSFREGTKTWELELEALGNAFTAWVKAEPGRKLTVFIDGLDENLDELEGADNNLPVVLQKLLVEHTGQIVWVLSSQPRQALDILLPSCRLVRLDGLQRSEAERVLHRILPEDCTDTHPWSTDDFLERSRLASSLHDPEMLVLLGRTMRRKLAGFDVIGEDELDGFLAALPSSPGEKYPWLFAQFSDMHRCRDVFGLHRSEKEWQRQSSSIPYTTLLVDLLCLLALVRRPIPLAILQWALELEDMEPTEDFRGRRQFAYHAYPAGILEQDEGLLLRMALTDLQRAINIVHFSQGSVAFSKEAHRRACLRFAPEKSLHSARARLAGLAREELRSLRAENLDRRHSYLFLELLHLLSLSATGGSGLERLLALECFPEWLQERALRTEDAEWLDTWLLESEACSAPFPGGTIAERRRVLVNTFLMEWRVHFERNPEFLAGMIRGAATLRPFWQPIDHRLLVS